MKTGLPGASIAAALVVVAWVAMPLVRDDATGKQAVAQPAIAIVPVTTTPAAAAVAEWTPVDSERLTDYVTAHRDVTPFRYRGGPAAVPASFSAPGGAATTPASQ